MRSGSIGAEADAIVQALVRRSNEIGADLRNTNYGGGNTSAKGTIRDPITDRRIEVMWVKGSGGDLGTLLPEGLALLRLDLARQLGSIPSGDEDEDRIHGLLQLCELDPEGAAPSIDTTLHVLIDKQHVDHLHPDSVIALAAASDGEELTRRCYGDEVGWVPWRRPGIKIAAQVGALVDENPRLRGVVMGGHGLTAWGDTSEECKQNSLDLIRRAREFIEAEGRSEPLGAIRSGFESLSKTERRARAAALAPVLRGLASTDLPVIGRWSDDEHVLDFIGRERTPQVVPLGTSCPDHLIRTKVRPLLLDLPSAASIDEQVERLRVLHAEYRDEYRDYYERHADDSTPPMRGADPAIFLIPGVGMFSFGSDSHTARVAGEFYVNAMNVIRGSESVSRYEPISDGEKFRVEYWDLEEAKLRRRPKPKALAGKVALVTGGGSGIGRSIAMRLAASGAVVAVADVDSSAAEAVAREIGDSDTAIAVTVDVNDEVEVGEAVDEVVRFFGGIDILVNNAGLSISKPLESTTVADWDRVYNVMARGSFLFSRSVAAKMTVQGRGGDIVYVVSKNAVASGPSNLAYGSAKASQAHQVRLLAAELGSHGIRVNGVNPDGVVKGSGIFAGDWGDDRAKVYGVEREDLGKFYAGRTLLKQEVLPVHVADAVVALVSGGFDRTTGTLVPVDSGIPAAFLR